MVCFADDATLVAEFEDDQKRQLYCFNQVARHYNMTVSTKQTKNITFSGKM